MPQNTAIAPGQEAGVGITIGVVVRVTVVTAAGGPAGTIGLDDVLVVTEEPDELCERDVVVDGCRPSGITIGVDAESPPP